MIKLKSFFIHVYCTAKKFNPLWKFIWCVLFVSNEIEEQPWKFWECQSNRVYCDGWEQRPAVVTVHFTNSLGYTGRSLKPRSLRPSSLSSFVFSMWRNLPHDSGEKKKQNKIKKENSQYTLVQAHKNHAFVSGILTVFGESAHTSI